jgi:hypothetical protein
MRPSPVAVHEIATHLALVVDCPVVFRCVMSLCVKFANWGGLRAVLVGRACDFLARAGLENAGVIAAPCVVVIWLNKLWLRSAPELPGRVTVDNLSMWAT